MILSLCPNPSVDTFIHVDQFTPGGVHRVTSEERFAGGKGVHVALAAAEMGEEVSLLAFWGGATGRWLRRACEKQKVTCEGPTLAGDSRTCMTLRAPAPYDQTEILGLGPKLSNSKLAAFHDTFTALVPAATVITMSGSWPTGASAGAYADLLNLARPVGTPILLDTTGPMLTAALAQQPHGVHLNRSEANVAFGENDPLKSVQLLARHCRVAVITDGAAGAYFSIDGVLLHGQCTITAAHSFVGSGDCLMAGLAVAIKRRLASAEAVALACACGAANCLRPELGMLRRADVERLTQQAQVRRLP